MGSGNWLVYKEDFEDVLKTLEMDIKSARIQHDGKVSDSLMAVSQTSSWRRGRSRSHLFF